MKNKSQHKGKEGSFVRHACGWMLWAILSFPIPQLLADQIIFSEIMYHPKLEKDSAWIELENLTSTPLDCADWTLQGKSLKYSFPTFDRSDPSSSFIQPFERLLITKAKPNEFRIQYKIPDHIRIFGPWEGEIDRGKEQLELRDKNGIGLCRLNFNNDPPWPLEAAGAGYSMVIQEEDRTVNHWSNWKASAKPGGSPGIGTFPEEGVQFQLTNADAKYNRELLLPMEVSWRYHEGDYQISNHWMSPDFDDSSWKSGEGLLGFENESLPSPGIRTPLRKGPMSYYFKTQFILSQHIKDGYVEVNQVLDDGAIYYLNGNAIGFSRMPSRRGQTRPDAPASQSVANAILEEGVFRINSDALQQGINTLAVEVHQINQTSTDLVFGAELWMVTRIEELPIRLVEIGMTGHSEGYAVVENISESPKQLSHYWITAANDPETTPRTVASFASETLKPGDGRQISLDSPISTRAIMAIASPSNRNSLLKVPLQLPQAGFRQFLVNASQNIWKVVQIPPEASQDNAAPVKGKIRITEVVFPNQGDDLKVELSHTHPHEISLSGLSLAHQGSLNQPQLLEGNIEGNSIASVGFKGLPKGKKRLKLFLLNQETQEILDAIAVDIQSGRSLQRSGFHSTEWYSSAENTLDQPNKFHAQDAIVINEIMYDPPFGRGDLEYIELYNKGEDSIPLDQWRFEDAIDYEFPSNTRIESGQYIVIAKNPEAIQKTHPGLNCLGPFQGKLGNDGELLRLLDQDGNLADEVYFKGEGDWPELARGKGSSMELLHPEAENSVSSAWKDSRESRSSEFIKFKFTVPYRGYVDHWHTMDHQELHLYLTGESHVVLRNIQFKEEGQTENLLSNPERLSIEGDSSTGWLIQGNHGDSFVENERLHLIAHGHGDNRANRAEIDITKLERGKNYELEFEARWVHGSPRLIARTWENSLSESILLPIPESLGTPGKANSNLQTKPSPSVENLKQIPAVPSPGGPLKISAEIGWPSGIGKVNLVYRLDGLPDQPWTRKPMLPSDKPDQSESKVKLYEITINEEFKQGDLIQYYVEAVQNEGSRTTLPRKPGSKPALCVFDERVIPNDLRVIRLLISSYHLDAIFKGTSEEYGYRYPRLSNQYFNSTFISNERDIFHGAELRASGSPWTRQNTMDRGKFRLPKDRLFRDHGKFAFDNDPTRNGGAVRHHNRMARYLLYLLGHVNGQNEFVYVIINAGNIRVREDVEPVDADYLNRNFANGNQGELYRVDDDWWMSDHWSQANRDASWRYFNTDHPAHYRHSWMKRSKEEEDDYTEFIDFIKLINRSNYTQEEIEAVLDPEAMLKMTAVMGYIADWDTFTQSRGKNAYFYQRANDRKFQLLHWDSDLAFGGRNYNSFYGGSSQFIQWVEKPYNYPRLMKYLKELSALTTDPQGRVEAWMREESKGNPYTQINFRFYRRFFQNRAKQVERLN